MPRPQPKFKLYWIETADHCEDWFVVSRTAREGRRFFEEMEGYHRGDSRSTLVKTLGNEGKTWWPTLDELRQYGLKILRAETPRVAVYEGVRYAEGILEHSMRVGHDNLLEAVGRGRPNKTDFEIPQ